MKRSLLLCVLLHVISPLQARSWHDTLCSTKAALGLSGLLGTGYLLSRKDVREAMQEHPYYTLMGLLSAGLVGSVGYSWLSADDCMSKIEVAPHDVPAASISDRDFITMGSTPTYRSLHTNGMIQGGTYTYTGDYKTLRRVTLTQFEAVLDRFFITMQEQLKDEDTWLTTAQHLPVLLNNQDSSFVPYAKKLLLSPGSTCICKGDLHGDIHSLLTFLGEYAKRGHTKDGTHLIFHGDYVDRGLWGTEVLYTLMLLKITNPEFVHLIRGNHEDVDLCARYGFKKEFFAKFADEELKDVERCYNKIAKLYCYLPVVLYLGSGTTSSADYVQCCHGGIEIGYNPQEFLKADKQCHYHWIKECKRATNCSCLPAISVQTDAGSKPLSDFCQDFVPTAPMRPYALGFMWYDFVVDPTKLSKYTSGRGLAANKELTHAVLKQGSSATHRLCGIIRAHQHNPSMKKAMTRLMLSSHGCARLWDQPGEATFTYKNGMIITLLLSPDSAHGMPRKKYPGFTYDTSLRLTLGKAINEWRGDIWNLSVSA